MGPVPAAQFCLPGGGHITDKTRHGSPTSLGLPFTHSLFSVQPSSRLLFSSAVHLS